MSSTSQCQLQPVASEPPKKKRHLENDDHNESSQEITRSPDLWFEDGNIVLQVEATQFRVHRSVLSVHSKFFEEMFMIPQPNGEALVDGCPVIVVPDKAEDWKNVLTIIYMSTKLYHKLDDYRPDIIVSMLHLGAKYQIDHIRDTAIQSLKLSLPTDAISWEDSSGESTGFEFELINGALEIGLESVLPVLYLMCLKHYSLDQIFDGVNAGERSRCSLPDEIKKMLFRARDKIRLKTTELIVDSKSFRNEDWFVEGKCDAQCSANRPMAIAFILRRPMEVVTFGLDYPDFPEDLGCEGCYLTDWSYEVSSKLWNMLPSFFDLPRWKTLQASDKAKFTPSPS